MPTLDEIIGISESVFNMPAGCIMTHNRSKNVAAARAVAMFFCKKYSTLSFSELGYRFKRDNSTIIHNVYRIGKKLKAETLDWMALRALLVEERINNV